MCVTNTCAPSGTLGEEHLGQTCSDGTDRLRWDRDAQMGQTRSVRVSERDYHLLSVEERGTRVSSATCTVHPNVHPSECSSTISPGFSISDIDTLKPSLVTEQKQSASVDGGIEW